MLSDEYLCDPMTTQTAAIPQPARASDRDWTDLCARLVREFPDLDAKQIFNEVTGARDATELFEVDPAERLRLATIMARNNLTLLSGGADLARLDPERRVREAHTDS